MRNDHSGPLFTVPEVALGKRVFLLQEVPELVAAQILALPPCQEVPVLATPWFSSEGHFKVFPCIFFTCLIFKR